MKIAPQDVKPYGTLILLYFIFVAVFEIILSNPARTDQIIAINWLAFFAGLLLHLHLFENWWKTKL